MTADSSKSISLHCPNCSHNLRLEINQIGVKGACVSCDAPIIGIEQAPSEYAIVVIDEQNLVAIAPPKQANHSPNTQIFLEPSPQQRPEPQQIPEQVEEQEAEVPNESKNKAHNPFTQKQPSENSFDKKAESAAIETSAPESSEVIPRSFMDDEILTDKNSLSAFSGITGSSSEESASLTDISGSAQVVQAKLKRNKVNRPSIGAPAITAIILGIVIGGCSMGFHFAPVDTKTAIKGQFAEWLEPGEIVIEKLPFGLDKKMLNFIETSLPPKRMTVEDQ